MQIYYIQDNIYNVYSSNSELLFRFGKDLHDLVPFLDYTLSDLINIC